MIHRSFIYAILNNSLMIEIPIKFVNSHKNAKHIVIDRDRLSYYLDLRETDVETLVAAGLMPKEAKKKTPTRRINYAELAREYQRRIDSGGFSSRASMARSLGVSRAWISKVLKRVNY